MTAWIELCLLVPLAPLAGAVIAGLFGRTIGRLGAHSVAILGVTVATVVSGLVFRHVVLSGQPIEGLAFGLAIQPRFLPRTKQHKTPGLAQRNPRDQRRNLIG